MPILCHYKIGIFIPIFQLHNFCSNSGWITMKGDIYDGLISLYIFFSYMSWNCLHRKNFAMRKTIWSFARKNINAPKNVLLFPRFIGSHPVNTQRFFILSRRFQRQNILQIVHNVCVIISFFAGQKSHVSVANQARNYSNWITINTIERMMN